MNIIQGKTTRPQRVVIYGCEGVGKSTLAALNAPSPLFLDTEDGTSHLDVHRVPIRSLGDLRDALRELLAMRKKGACAYKSIILDTADHLWSMCAEDVCAANNWASIETPGYGRGYAQASETFRAVFRGFDALVAAGYHVVIVCHAKIDKVTPPDNPEYTKYMIKVSAPTKAAETSREFIKEWCDALMFCRFDVAVNAEERRALGKEARRVISTEPCPAWEAKNRLGLPKELKMDAGALASLFEAQEAPAAPVRAAVPAQDPTPAPAEDDETVTLSNGQTVNLSQEAQRLLERYFRATGKLQDGAPLSELPANIADALAARPAQAIAAARRWEDNQSTNNN